MSMSTMRLEKRRCIVCGGPIPPRSHWNRKVCSDHCREIRNLKLGKSQHEGTSKSRKDQTWIPDPRGLVRVCQACGGSLEKVGGLGLDELPDGSWVVLCFPWMPCDPERRAVRVAEWRDARTAQRAAAWT